MLVTGVFAAPLCNCYFDFVQSLYAVQQPIPYMPIISQTIVKGPTFGRRPFKSLVKNVLHPTPINGLLSIREGSHSHSSRILQKGEVKTIDFVLRYDPWSLTLMSRMNQQTSPFWLHKVAGCDRAECFLGEENLAICAKHRHPINLSSPCQVANHVILLVKMQSL